MEAADPGAASSLRDGAGDDDPPIDDVIVHEHGATLDAVEAIAALAALPGTHRLATGVLTATAGRLREVLTREEGVDGHEVLEVMVTSLSVRRRRYSASSRPVPSDLERRRVGGRSVVTRDPTARPRDGRGCRPARSTRQRHPAAFKSRHTRCSGCVASDGFVCLSDP